MNEHYSTPHPTSIERSGRYEYAFAGRTLVFETVSGVFGKSRLDRGSQVLIEHADLSGARSLLDLGCGIGVVGVSLAARYPDIEVTFADVNDRAVRTARQNAKRNGFRGSFVVSDGFERIRGSFDAIALNPPQSAGKQVCERLIADAREHLNPHGRLFVVARHNKGGRSLSAFMELVFGDLETVARKSGYRVYVSEVRA